MSLQLTITKWSLSTFVLTLISIAVTVGCGPSPPPTGSITGVVTSKGEPVECYLLLSDAVARQNTGTKCNEEGVFEQKGILFGEYKVAVKQITDSHSAGATPVDKRIPEKYRSIKTTDLSVSIQGEEPVVLNIEME